MNVGRLSLPRAPVSSTQMLVHIHGNSLGAGVGASAPSKWWPAVMSTLPPLAGQSVTVRNRSVGGMSFYALDGMTPTNMATTAPAEIDAALSSAALNVLFVHEFINELRANGNNATAAFDECKKYCLARKASAAAAGKRLSIVICTTTPVRAGATDALINARMAGIIQTNTWLREQYRDFSDVLCDVAMWEPFRSLIAGGDWSTSAFSDAQVFNKSDGNPPDWAHLGDAGYAILAKAGALALAKVRVR